MTQEVGIAQVAKEGLVIAHLGQGIAVEFEQETFLCQTLRKLDTVAVGDKVLWFPTAPGQGRIEEILPRRSLLARPSRNKKVRPVAANIDQVLVVIAVEPWCDFLLIDQYLAVCEHNRIEVSIVVNKLDLPQSEAIEQELLIYENLGYPVFRVSTLTGEGLNDLNTVLQSQVSLLAGQSGVGKSSLTNSIIPDIDIRTNAISSTTKHGRHTTTAATLYHIDCNSPVIDSPGVAIFGLADLNGEQLAGGYREFAPLLRQCQFNDCRHQQDKGCAVRDAVGKGDIAASRYGRFLKLTEKMRH